MGGAAELPAAYTVANLVREKKHADGSLNGLPASTSQRQDSILVRKRSAPKRPPSLLPSQTRNRCDS